MALAKIVYASMTGNTEEIADIVSEALENLDMEVEMNGVPKWMPMSLKTPISVSSQPIHTVTVNCLMRSSIFTKICKNLI